MGACLGRQTDSVQPLARTVEEEEADEHPTELRPSVQVEAKPADEHLTKLDLPGTPSTKTRQIYKFYCPICFAYFKEIYKTECCENYICELCAKSFLQKKLSLDALPEVVPDIQVEVNCPLCNVDRVKFELVVSSTQNPRNYQESPNTRQLMADVARRRSERLTAVKAGSQNSRSNLQDRLSFTTETKPGARTATPSNATPIASSNPSMSPPNPHARLLRQSGNAGNAGTPPEQSPPNPGSPVSSNSDPATEPTEPTINAAEQAEPIINAANDANAAITPTAEEATPATPATEADVVPVPVPVPVSASVPAPAPAPAPVPVSADTVDTGAAEQAPEAATSEATAPDYEGDLGTTATGLGDQGELATVGAVGVATPAAVAVA